MYTFYNLENHIEFQGNYNNDLKDGVWNYYNDDGTIDYSLDYKNGNLTNDLKKSENE